MRAPKISKAAVCFMLLLLLGGCAGHRAFVSGQEAMDRGDYDQAVTSYFEAVSENPQRKEYLMNLRQARAKAAQRHLANALVLIDKGDLAGADAELEQAVALDPTLERASQERETVRKRRQLKEQLDEAEQLFRVRKFSQAKNSLQNILSTQPGNQRAEQLLKKVQQGQATIVDGYELDVDSTQPLTLKFKQADVRDVFKILSRLSGINFIFDDDVRAKNVTVLLEKATFSQALELLLKMNELDKRVLNANTIILFPKTREKQKQYQDQLIQVFYLSNIDAKKAVNMLRTMLQLRKVFVHEELNALVVRDSPDAIKLAQQIIEAADRTDSEVVFELELIEVAHTDTLQLGAGLSPYAVSAGLAKEGGTQIVNSALDSGTETANLVSGLSNLQTFYTLPTASFNFAKTLTDSEVLASPKVRVKNKGKAKVHIGSREPVITVTINGDQTSENVQYVDVGVKLDVEPTIQLDGGIITKLNLEVSSVTGRQRSESTGTTVLTISTTNTQTELTLKDGEQTVIGGLIREEDSKDKNSIPLLGDLPLIGDLFTSHSNTKNKREILLSITPHIVKKVDLPGIEQASIWSGGEDDLKAGPSFGNFSGAFQSDMEQPPPPIAPALQEEGSAVSSEDEALTAPLDDETLDTLFEETPAPVEEEEQLAPQGGAVPGASERTGETPFDEEGQASIAADDAQAGMPEAAPADEGDVEQVTLQPLEVPEAQSQSRLYFEGPQLLDVGAEVTVEARIADVENVYSAPLFVRYDKNVLDFLRAEEGEFLKADGQSTVFTVSADRDRGELIIGYKQGVSGEGASGSGDLFRLVFRAREPGVAQVAFDRVNLRDREGVRLPASAETWSVEVR